MPSSVEFSRTGKGHMVHIEIEPHADGIGGDQIIHFARLIEFDLRIAGARRQSAQHNGGTAALPPHQFGDRINLLSGKSDNGRTARQPHDFHIPRIGQLRQAGPRHDMQARQKRRQNGPHGFRADQQCFLAAAHIEQAVGKHMAAVKIRRQLNFINGHKGKLQILRHGFDRCHPITGIGRFDFFLTRHQGHGMKPRPINQTAIDFTGQKPQRQADQTTAMRQHPLDRIMGFSGIGGAEDSHHTARAQTGHQRRGHPEKPSQNPKSLEKNQPDRGETKPR